MADVQATLRKALQQQFDAIGDSSRIPELEMLEQIWPGGVQPTTAPPTIEKVADNTVILKPAATHDSIGYQIDSGRWLAYAPGQSLQLPAGATLQVKAVRYGWKDSAVVSRAY